MSIFQATYRVSFGDCDPAGIVYYPNFFAWLDRTFHAFLTERGGGHKAICERLEAKGIGLVKADCGFRVPVAEGDALTIAIEDITWEERIFTVSFAGLVDDMLVFKGSETRARFIEQGGRMRAGDLAGLRAILSAESNEKLSN